MGQATVTIRMYNVGFGDSFLITVREHELVWRMLVDCGVHSHGRAQVNGVSRPIRDVVDAIITHLEESAPAGGHSHLDVVVATHHHADHISGFSIDDWERVDVAEVWVPFIEDADDEDATKLRMGLTGAADTLRGLIEEAAGTPNRGDWGNRLRLAHDFAVNSFGNADATDRLLGRNGKKFARDPTDVRIRYLPDRDSAKNEIATTVPGASVHILGPSRDPDQLKRMDPPAAVAWLRLDADQKVGGADQSHLFSPTFQIRDDDEKTRLPDSFVKARNAMRLRDLAADAGALLAASSLLERSVNNTSIAFVLDVNGIRFLFVGDSQHGAWDHLLDDARAQPLVKDVAFYKVGHHGSHNATPKRFVRDFLGDGATAMLPWGLVNAWKDTIPKKELLDALDEKRTRLVRADKPAGDGVTVGPDLLWSEVSFDIP